MERRRVEYGTRCSWGPTVVACTQRCTNINRPPPESQSYVPTALLLTHWVRRSVVQCKRRVHEGAVRRLQGVRGEGMHPLCKGRNKPKHIVLETVRDESTNNCVH